MGDYDSFFHQLLHDGDLPAIARQVLRQAVTAENLQYFCKPPQVGRATPPHQDGYYFMLQPCAAVTMWLAIDRVDAENGCVRYVPGSHKLGMRPHHRTETLGFSQGIMDYPTEEDLTELAIPAEPGDLLVHHALTIHRADGNNSRQRTRRALGMVYFGEHAERDAEAHAAYQRQLTADMKASGKIETSLSAEDAVNDAQANLSDPVLQQAIGGDESAMAKLFDRYRSRLHRMITLRLDPRVQGRVDASDILQEAYLDLAQRLNEYAKAPKIEFYLWLRLVTGQRLAQAHRKHLGTKMRNAALEVSLHQGETVMPQASNVSLASRLVGQMTSVGERVVRAEMQQALAGVLTELEAEDCEILALRHFEELTNAQVGQLLGITESGASKRYFRALRRLRSAGRRIPGLFDDPE